jgi:RNA-directed DNA polymerase
VITGSLSVGWAGFSSVSLIDAAHWIQYYSRFYPSELTKKLYRFLDHQIAAWRRRKYKQLRSRWGRSWQLLKRIRQQRSDLFAHWRGAGVVVSG